MIEFRKITGENFNECISIDTGVDDSVIQPVSMQLAISYAFPSKIPLAAYEGDDLIGFVSYERDSCPEPAYDILVIIIKSELQGMGFGKKTLEALIEYLFDKEDCERITLNYSSRNKRAERLYKGAGFRQTGRFFSNDELVLKLEKTDYMEMNS